MQIKDAIQTLIAAGISQNQIAVEAQCSQGLISHLVTGRVVEVKHSLGQRIIAMSERVSAGAAEKAAT